MPSTGRPHDPVAQLDRRGRSRAIPRGRRGNLPVPTRGCHRLPHADPTADAVRSCRVPVPWWKSTGDAPEWQDLSDVRETAGKTSDVIGAISPLGGYRHRLCLSPLEHCTHENMPGRLTEEQRHVARRHRITCVCVCVCCACCVCARARVEGCISNRIDHRDSTSWRSSRRSGSCHASGLLPMWIGFSRPSYCSKRIFRKAEAVRAISRQSSGKSRDRLFEPARLLRKMTSPCRFVTLSPIRSGSISDGFRNTHRERYTVRRTTVFPV